MADVLIIDDDLSICRLLTTTVEREGHTARHVQSLAAGLLEIDAASFDVLFLDIHLPDGNGLDVLPRLQATQSPPEVIIITGDGDPDGAELAIQSGAWDYIAKTSPIKHIVLSLNRAIQYRQQKLSRVVPIILNRCGIIGSSALIQSCLELAAQAAMCDASVLISGDTGTGKELFARVIHENSRRRNNNFVIVDCATLPDTLVESILFGHRKGAFTGADRDRSGLFKQADGGTVFLDEIGELPLGVQKAFLRVLQEQKFRPVGGREEVRSNFRVIAATNRDLVEMARENRFREDLLFRLRSLAIELPVLRQTGDDLNELFNARMNELCQRYGIGPKGVSPDFFDILHVYDWPGNVRELFNAVDQVLSAAMHEPTIFPKHLPTNIRARAMRASIGANGQPDAATAADAVAPVKTMCPLRDYRDEMDKNYLQELAVTVHGNIVEACRVSGLSRSRLYALLQQYNISFRLRSN